MEGWRPVEDLIQWGFAHAPVVMANEAHDGLARSVRTREVGVRMVRAAHEAGVRRLAMEALHWPTTGMQGPIRDVPSVPGGYLAQPDMRRLIGAALDLGWTLWAYEAVFEITADTDQDRLLSMEFTNWREREQAGNLGRLLTAAVGARVAGVRGRDPSRLRRHGRDPAGPGSSAARLPGRGRRPGRLPRQRAHPMIKRLL